MSDKKIEDMTDEEAFVAAMGDEGDQQQGQQDQQQDPVDDQQLEGDQQQPVENEGDEGVDNGQDPSQPAQQDPLAALPEELRNRFTEMELANQQLQQELAKTRNDHASMAGKLRPLQQKLAALENKRDAAPAPPAQGSGPQTIEDLDALIETEEFKEWSKLFPEEAKMWRANTRKIIEVAEKIAERRVAQAVQSLAGRIDPVLETVVQDQAIKGRELRVAELAKVHPDWQEHSNSDEFSDWFNNEYMPSLPEEIQAQFADPAVVTRALSQPKYAARVLTEYKRDRGLTTASATAPPPEVPATPTAPAKVNPRLALSAAPQAPAPPPTSRVSLANLTPEQQFLAGLNSPD